MRRPLAASLLLGAVMPLATQDTSANPFLRLMQHAASHAAAHHARVPTLSPEDTTILDPNPATAVPVAALHAAGIKVVPWTTNDPEKMRAVIRTGVDGLISDRPDLLMQVLAEERATATPEVRARLATFDAQAHRGGRGLRPENTLPSFESGMDQGAATLETDTAVTTDHVSLIWHDQFLNPQSCRHADGTPYTLDNRAYIRDLSMPQAQATFICDKLHFGSDQRNDLSLSPVAVAFARQEQLISPYVPTGVEQLFRFTRFYAEYYRTGPGRGHQDAAKRAHTGETIHFNLETKIVPDRPAIPNDEDAHVPAEMFDNHTVSPQLFVDTLCGTIVRNHMESRADVQSFDFRTLILVEAQYPSIRTVYLTEDVNYLSSSFVPLSLR